MEYQSKFWNSYFKYYDILLKVIPYRELFEKIVDSLELKSNNKILDLGSGTGNLQLFLPDNTEVHSLDNSKEALQRLKNKFPEAIAIKHSILEKLPFDDNMFDRVVSNNVLYTLRDDEWDFVISEIRRVSKPESVVVISNLNKSFKAINIYKDHIKKSVKRKGIINTSLELATLTYSTIRMIQFNSKINKNDETGRYSFLDSEEQKLKFERYDLMNLKSTEEVYSKQAYLNVFINRKKMTANKA